MATDAATVPLLLASVILDTTEATVNLLMVCEERERVNEEEQVRGRGETKRGKEERGKNRVSNLCIQDLLTPIRS